MLGFQVSQEVNLIDKKKKKNVIWSQYIRNKQDKVYEYKSQKSVWL